MNNRSDFREKLEIRKAKIAMRNAKKLGLDTSKIEIPKSTNIGRNRKAQLIKKVEDDKQAKLDEAIMVMNMSQKDREKYYQRKASQAKIMYK